MHRDAFVDCGRSACSVREDGDVSGVAVSRWTGDALEWGNTLVRAHGQASHPNASTVTSFYYIKSTHSLTVTASLYRLAIEAEVAGKSLLHCLLFSWDPARKARTISRRSAATSSKQLSVHHVLGYEPLHASSGKYPCSLPLLRPA